MNTAGSLAKDVGVKSSCDALAVPRASFYRWCDREKHSMKDNCRPVPPLALTYDERKDVLDTLREERFVDQAPQEVYAALLGNLSLLCKDHVPHSGRKSRSERTEKSVKASPLYETGDFSNSTQSSVVLGYNEAQRTGKVDVLLSLRHP